jgi:hypothetical protein
MIIPVPEWENEVAWPGGSLAQSDLQRLGAEYDPACDRASAQPTSTALAQYQASKEAVCLFLLGSWLTLLLVSLSKLGAYKGETPRLFCLLWQLAAQAGSVAPWLQPWETAWTRGQRARLLPFVINSHSHNLNIQLEEKQLEP